MTEDRKRIREKYMDELESSTRFGDFSLEKYTHNDGYIVFHWPCGRWSHSFYNDSKNCCPSCTYGIHLVNYPDELEQVYRIANFDLMADPVYNASVHD